VVGLLTIGASGVYCAIRWFTKKQPAGGATPPSSNAADSVTSESDESDGFDIEF